MLLVLAVALFCSPCVGFLCCTSGNLLLPGCSAVSANAANSVTDCNAVNDLVLAFNTALNPSVGACASRKSVGRMFRTDALLPLRSGWCRGRHLRRFAKLQRCGLGSCSLQQSEASLGRA